MEREELFLRAKPVWEDGKEKVSNYTLLFRTEIEGKYALKDKVVIKLTGHTVYKLYINGNFVLHGPARTAHNYWRVDELEINKYLTQESNTVSILVGGYYCYSYAYTGQPSFLCAEINSQGTLTTTLMSTCTTVEAENYVPKQCLVMNRR